MELRVEIVAKDFIKPSIPIPNHLKCYKLSLLDQLAPQEYIPLVLYYCGKNHSKSAEISQQLKESLSKTLVHFYPLAGRINVNGASVNCTGDDIGVPYTEANVVGASCTSLEDMLEERDYEMVKVLLPLKGLFKGANMIPLQIQTTFFQCGGIAIGFGISHMIADGIFLSEFIRSWATTAQLGQHVMSPVLSPDPHRLKTGLMTFSSLLPPRHNLVKLQPPEVATYYDGSVTKAFKFTASSIAALKANVIAAGNDYGGSDTRPTRVQAVTALIWKCLINIATRKSFSNPKTKLTKNSSVLQVYVNMRTRLNPPLPQNNLGNFVEFFTIQKNYNNDDKNKNINLQELISLQFNGLKDFCNNHINKLQDSMDDMSSVTLDYVRKRQKTLTRDDVDLFVVSSWCGFKFYEVDFGWGKPIWVSTYYAPYCNFFVLIDTKEGDGVEAWVSFKKEDMVAFEQDNELLSYLSTPTRTIFNN